MVALIFLALNLVVAVLKPKSRLEAENAVLKQQLIVLRRKVQQRVPLTRCDRLFFVHLYRWFRSILKVITIVSPETLVRWHRAGFRRYRRWSYGLPICSRPCGSDRVSLPGYWQIGHPSRRQISLR